MARGKRREGQVGRGEGALSACVPAAVPTPETAGRWRAPVNAAVGAKGAVGGGHRGRRPSAPSRRVATATVQDAAAAGGLACGRHGGHTGCAKRGGGGSWSKEGRGRKRERLQSGRVRPQCSCGACERGVLMSPHRLGGGQWLSTPAEAAPVPLATSYSRTRGVRAEGRSGSSVPGTPSSIG